MYTGKEEDGINILKSFAREAGNEEEKFTGICDGLCSTLGADKSKWLFFLHRLGDRDLENLNLARKYLELPLWGYDDVITKL